MQINRVCKPTNRVSIISYAKPELESNRARTYYCSSARVALPADLAATRQRSCNCRSHPAAAEGDDDTETNDRSGTLKRTGAHLSPVGQ